MTHRFPSTSCGRRWRPRRLVWRTHASSVSSTTTAPSRSMPPTRRTADPTSASNCSRPRTSGPSLPHRWSDPRRRIKVWRCFRAGFTVASRPCRDPTANRTRSPSRIISLLGRAHSPARGRLKRGRRYNSATAVRPSRPTPDGWCSLTESVPCARTASGRSCSISTIQHGFSAGYGNRCSAPPPTSGTATCPTSSTPAAHSCTPRPWCSHTASRTLPSASRPCRWPTSSMPLSP